MNDYNPHKYWNIGKKRVVLDLPEKEQEQLIAWLEQIKPRHTLEVGTGYGRIINVLKDRTELLSACDIAPYQRMQCYARTGVYANDWDGKHLPYEDDTFDLVVSFDVLLHVPPDDARLFTMEHVRVSNEYLIFATLMKYTGELAPHCFVHDTSDLFAGLECVDRAGFGNRAMFLMRT